ncbi:hypothetical protein KPH14_012064 [Odynerus spinipes]|uniref:Uncharacterized protein n=1 Tax=Odynerus spinipes TaxID=1348599 RepID=A0AAD9R9P8_9HYME|nr:hypothetical protein KPH14_012064 [Odynerus spinipes]
MKKSREQKTAKLRYRSRWMRLSADPNGQQKYMTCLCIIDVLQASLLTQYFVVTPLYISTTALAFQSTRSLTLDKEVEVKTRHVLEEINFITNRHIHDSLSRRENGAHDIANVNKKNPECSAVTNDKLTQNNTFSLHTLTENSSNLSKQNFEKLPNQNGRSVKADNIVLCEGNSLENKTLTNFFKTKIDMLHNELRVIQLEYKNKDSYCEKLESENKKLDCSKLKLCNQLGSLKETVTKLENNNADLYGQNLALNAENFNLKKDMEGLKKEIKTLSNQLNNYDLRLNRSLEENEKLKNTIKFNRLEEKELRDQVRKLTEEKKQEIKHLEKQRLELHRAFKKQLLLIDNLKKQNAFLIAFERVQLAEEDFSKLLSWKPDNS